MTHLLSDTPPVSEIDKAYVSSLYISNHICFLESQVKQWISKYGWSIQNDGNVFITNQEENIKTKNITEKITFESKL